MNILSEIAACAENSDYQKHCDLILKSGYPYSRATIDGHITASGLVIHDKKVLLIFHPYIKEWFQPGGHIDDGESPPEAAIREVYEETGFVCQLHGAGDEPIDINIHQIPANPNKGEGAHIHIDLLYRLKIVRQEQPSKQIAFKWFEFDRIESVRIQRALAGIS